MPNNKYKTKQFGLSYVECCDSLILFYKVFIKHYGKKRKKFHSIYYSIKKNLYNFLYKITIYKRVNKIFKIQAVPDIKKNIWIFWAKQFKSYAII